MEPRYHINVFWSDEDEAWIADCPDLKYCSATGENPVEAVQELMIGQKAWLETARANGRESPEAK